MSTASSRSWWDVTTTIRAAQRAWSSGSLRILPAAELAVAAGVSPGHLFRVFRAELGCGPARALELVRLARSAAMLQRSNASLPAVAAQHGFANAYHFSRRFSQAYRMPPGTFRTLGLGPDPLEPIRRAGLLPFAAPFLAVLLEHDPVYTIGRRGTTDHLKRRHASAVD